MSRQNTPAEGYMVEHKENGETYMLGYHSPTGFKSAVLPKEVAEKIAKRLSAVYGRPFNVVPAPALWRVRGRAKRDAGYVRCPKPSNARPRGYRGL